MNGNVQNNATFFNFVADAVGYLNEIKLVHPENGDAYVAVKAAILEGKPNKNGKIKQIYIDLNVKGQQALDVINSLQAYWPQGYGSASDHKWMAGIRFGSINAKTYFSKKSNAQVAMLTGSLIAFRWLKVNGHDVVVPEWHKSEDQQMQQAPQMQPQMQQAPRMQPQMQQAPQMQPQMQQAPQMQPQMRQAPQMQPQMQQAPQMQPQMQQAPQMQPQTQQAPQMQPQMRQAPQMPLQAPQILQ